MMSPYLSLPLLAMAMSALTATSSPLIPRSTIHYGLVFAPNSNCNANQTTQVLNAIADMRALSTAAVAALKTPNTLSSYFFQSSYFTPATAVFNALLYATQPLSDLPTDSTLGYNQIQLTCANATDETCATPAPGTNNLADKSSATTRWGYVGTNPVFGSGAGAAQIFACPALLNGTIPRSPQPCTGTPGLATVGWALLRTFVQLKTLQSVPKLATGKTISDHAPGVAQSHGLVESGSADYSLNADNFAELALWAGEGGGSGDKGQPFQCGQNIPFS